MRTKKEKSAIIAYLQERLERATGIYIVNYETMTVLQAEIFRKAMREKECEYFVAKNSLILKAVENIEGLELPKEKMVGMSGVVFAYDDPTAPSKIIKQKFDKEGIPALKLAILDGQLFDGAELDKVAKIPSKEDIYSSIVGSVNAPASGIYGVLNGVIRDVAILIEEVAKKQNAA